MRCAIVLGSAPCWRDDLEAVPHRELADVVAVNAAGVNYTGRIAHWVSLHGAEFEAWAEARERAGGTAGYRCHTTHPGAPDWVRKWNVTGDWRNGSSSFFAVRVALTPTRSDGIVGGPGYDRLVLAGVPLEGLVSCHLEGEHRYRQSDLDYWRQAWLRTADELRGKVRSMSGWTRELLGFPDDAWFPTD